MTPGEYVSQAVVAAIDVARTVRPSTRAGERHFRDGLSFRKGADGWDEVQRRAFMLRELRAVVRRAARETRFYRERFRAAGFDPLADFGFDDYAKLPVLERDDVLNASADMLVEAIPPALRRLDGTGGSTGIPLQYWNGPEERGWRASGQEHYMRHLGVPRGVRMAFLWGHHIDQRERTHWRERLRDSLSNRRWYDCFRLSSDVLLEAYADMQRFRPTCLTAYASALDSLSEVMGARGLRSAFPTRRIITGGEKLWAHQRARAEAVFDAPIHEQYGSREAGLIAMQLAPTSTLNFSIDFANAFIEPATDAPESDILLTKLHADAMPMLRYRMGDMGRFAPGACPGHPSFVLQEVLGRSLDRLVLRDGHWLHGIGIPHLMKDFPLRQFQIRQNADYTIDVLVVPNAGHSGAHNDRIRSTLMQNLPGLEITVRVVDEIPKTASNKWRPVVSLVAADASDGSSPPRA